MQDVAADRAEAIFQMLDINQDGQLGEDEFVQVYFVIVDLIVIACLPVNGVHCVEQCQTQPMLCYYQGIMLCLKGCLSDTELISLLNSGQAGGVRVGGMKI